jgi:O-antigen/teichoic acid export membrane protein
MTTTREVAHQSAGTATALALSGAAVTTIANFGIAVIVARAGASLAGLFFAATAVATITGNAAALGTMTALVYFMPAALDGPRPNPRGLVLTALRPVVVAGGAAAAVLVLTAPWLAGIVAGEAAAPATTMLRLLAITVPCWAVTVSVLGATRGLGSMTPTVAVNQVVRPLAQLVLVAMVVWASDDPSGPLMAAAWGGPVVVATGLALWWLWRLGGLTGGGRPTVSSSELWSYARPRAASTAGQIALERVDVVLVSALAGPAVAGVYGAISRFVTAANFVIFALGQATSNGLRRALVAHRRDEAQELLARTTGWMVLVAWPYLLVVAVKAPVLVRLLNPDFGSGATALSLLAVAVLVNALAGPVDLTLLMLGRSRSSLTVTVVALAVDVVVVWLAVPRFGLLGAALAWGAAVVAQNALAALLVVAAGSPEPRPRSSRGVAARSAPVTAGSTEHVPLRVGGRPALIAAAGSVLAVVPIGLATPDDLVGAAVTIVVGGVMWAGWALAFREQLGLGPRARCALSRRSRGRTR